MRFEVPPFEGPAALVFPGQGAQVPDMLEPFRGAHGFSAHYARICDLLAGDPLAESRTDPERLNRNAQSSLLTVLVSVLALELLRDSAPALEPVAAAGYSVGQWTALYAAGAFSAETLFRVVYCRARLMDECVTASEPSGMLAVIGVPAAQVKLVCDEASRQGMLLEITNDNAPGQVTLGGSLAALEFAEQQLRPLRPKRLQRVPVAGAWHSALLEGAVPELAALLDEIEIGPLRFPVIDNTTGSWLPEDPRKLRPSLARQVASPVLWRQGVQTMAASGVRCFLETGYGDILTRFGFFIDRSVQHSACIALRRAS